MTVGQKRSEGLGRTDIEMRKGRPLWALLMSENTVASRCVLIHICVCSPPPLSVVSLLLVPSSGDLLFTFVWSPSCHLRVGWGAGRGLRTPRVP